MDGKLHIRHYLSADKPALLEMIRKLVPEYFAQEEVADYEFYLDHEIELYFVAELQEKIVGAGGINFENSQHAKISWDFVDSDFLGKNIGSALLNHRLQFLKAKPEVTLISVRTSQKAYRFYEKNGFVLKETIPDFWAKGFDLYSMQLTPLPDSALSK